MIRIQIPHSLRAAACSRDDLLCDSWNCYLLKALCVVVQLMMISWRREKRVNSSSAEKNLGISPTVNYLIEECVTNYFGKVQYPLQLGTQWRYCMCGSVRVLVHIPDGVLDLLLWKYTGTVRCPVPAWRATKRNWSLLCEIPAAVESGNTGMTCYNCYRDGTIFRNGPVHVGEINRTRWLFKKGFRILVIPNRKGHLELYLSPTYLVWWSDS